MLNVAVLMGRLVADPELRRTQSDLAVCSFRIAVDRNYANKAGERQADFIDIVAWRSTAEFVCKYFTKGQMIAVEGSIQTRSYEDKQGNKRTAVEVVANNVSFCGSKRENGGGSPSGERGYDRGSSYGSTAYGGDTREDFSSVPSFADSAPAFSSGDDSSFETDTADSDLPF